MSRWHFLRRRGSVSMFLVVVIPLIIVSCFFLYDILYMRHRDEKALKIVSAVSEARLARYNEYLKKEYSLIANHTVAPLDEYVTDYMTDNGYLCHVIVYEHTLDDPKTFRDTIVRSVKGLFLEETLRELMDKVGLLKVKEELFENVKAMDKKLEGISKLMELPKEVGQLKDITDLSKVSGVLDLIEEKMRINGADLVNKSEELNSNLEGVGEFEEEYRKDLREIRSSFEKKQKEFSEFSGEIKEKIQLLAGSQENQTRLQEEIDQTERDLNSLKELFLNNNTPENARKIEELEETLVEKKSKLASMNEVLSGGESEIFDRLKKPVEDFDMSRFSALIESVRKGTEKLEKMFESVGTRGETLRLEKDYTLRSYFESGSMLEKIGIIEWCIKVFSHYGKDGEKEDHPIRGELEYLVSGNPDEEKSLQEVKLKIAGLRTIPNFLAFLKSEAKMEADAVIAVIPVPFLYIAKGLVYSALIVGESYIDVEALIKGEEIPLIKKSDDWKLSIKNLLEEETAYVPKFKKKAGGFGYQDYIRALLFLQSEPSTILRAMNLVSSGVIKRTGEKYDLNDFSVGHMIELNYHNQSAFKSRKSHIIYENAYE